MPSENRYSQDLSIASTLSKVSVPQVVHDDDILKPANRVNTECSKTALSKTTSRKSFASSIVEAIRDDNQITDSQEQDLIVPIPFYDEDSQTYDREFQRVGEEGEEEEFGGHGNSSNRVEKLQSDIVDDGEFAKEDLIDMPPDGGFWAWTAAFCVCMVNTFSWGGNSAYGVFLNYYLESDHFPGATEEQYAVIGGLALGVSFMLCNFAVVFVKRYNLKIVMSVGLIIEFVCYWLASIASTITQLIIFQGFLIAIGYALLAGPSFIIIPSWFLKRRSVASGIGVAGAGLSGVIFSKSCEAIISRTGSHVWALRMMALVSGFVLVISIILIKPRKPFNSKNTSIIKEFKKMIKPRVFKMKPILYIVAWNFIYSFAYGILLFTLPSFGTSIGLSSDKGSTVSTVQSVAQCFGRPAIGYFSDKFGRSNSTILITYFLVIICAFFWIFTTTYSQLIGFTFLSGWVLGINWVNFTPLAADVVGGGEELSSAVAFITFTCGIPNILSEIIALKLVRHENSRPYLYCQIFVVACAFVSGTTLLLFREWKIKRMVTARRQIIINRMEAHKEVCEKDRQRLKRYELLLKGGAMGYCMRMFYPIKA